MPTPSSLQAKRLCQTTLLCLFLAPLWGCGGTTELGPKAPTKSDVVKAENAKPGSVSWTLTNPATTEIEGYASAVSVARGESIQLFVNTADKEYSLEVFRLGWYGGAGARSMAPAVTLAGTAQAIPKPDPVTGMVACEWLNPYTLAIPKDSDPTVWASGLYLAKLTAGTSGKQSYIPFVVRDDERASSLLFQASVNTYQAYNLWGGTSLYQNENKGSTTPGVYSANQAVKVSFDRPYQGGGVQAGAGDMLRWEYNMARWLEKNGYDVTYTTDVDTDRAPEQLLNHRAFLVVGHDEYWTWQMRDSVEHARDHGIGVGYFGANASYWQVRYEASTNNIPRRIIVGYKETAMTQDPYATDNDPSNDHLITGAFGNRSEHRPAAFLFGLDYNTLGYDVKADLVITHTNNSVFENSGLKDGDHVTNALGYEVDMVSANSPANFVQLAHSPFTTSSGATSYSDMGMYQAASGAVVFSTGSINWIWALDNYQRSGYIAESTGAQQVTQNVLAMLGALPTP